MLQTNYKVDNELLRLTNTLSLSPMVKLVNLSLAAGKRSWLEIMLRIQRDTSTAQGRHSGCNLEFVISYQEIGNVCDGFYGYTVESIGSRAIESFLRFPSEELWFSWTLR